MVSADVLIKFLLPRDHSPSLEEVEWAEEQIALLRALRKSRRARRR